MAESHQTELFKLIEGLKPVDANTLEGFERDMIREAIPEIIRDVEKRRMLALDARQRRLEIPTTDEPELMK